MTSPSIRDIQIPSPQGRLHARQWQVGGVGAPIVLLHDSLGCVELWRDFPLQLALTTGRDVIAYDRLGFGRSDPFPGQLPASFIGDEARTSFKALREELRLERFIAFGHSVGGGMAAGCAGTFPEACEALITIAAQAFVEDRTLAGIREAEAMFAQPGQIDRLKRYHGEKAEWVLRAWIDTWTSAPFLGWTLDDSLRQVQCPALSMHGDRDEYGSTAHPHRIAELTGGQAIVLEDCGHVPHREKPEIVLEKVTGFLTRPLR